MEKNDIINELKKIYDGLEEVRIQYNPKEQFAINLKEWRGILRRVIKELLKEKYEVYDGVKEKGKNGK